MEVTKTEETQLNFKTEDERVEAMEKYSNDGGTDTTEIDRIMSAPVEEESPDAEVYEGNLENKEEANPVTEPKPIPQEDAQAERSWSITENDIPKDTYFDKRENKTRPFITQTSKEDFFKSYLHAQKRIHYLEDELMPQAKKSVQDESKAQYEAELQRLKLENESLKVTPVPQQQNVPAPQTNINTTDTLKRALEDIKGIDPDDSIEHTDKMQKALVSALSHIDTLQNNISGMKEQSNVLDGKFRQYEATQQEQESVRQQQAQKQEVENNWNKACGLVDTFATTNADFKTDYGVVDQPFKEMTREAVDFHVKLAGIKYNKHPDMVTNEEQMSASHAYLRGDNELLQSANQYGLAEPNNYKAWIELDQIDAMRTGLFRDPNTKTWQQIQDPVTQQSVHLGDMSTAYGKYLDVSGKRAEKTRAMLKSEQDNLTNAISRRDGGIVSMDTNQLRSDGSGSELTEQQALDIFNQVDPAGATTSYLRNGDSTQLDTLNRALERLELAPVPIPAREIDSRPKTLQ